MIQKTNPIEKYRLNPLRFLNWILIAMIVGLIATIVIAFDFIIGMSNFSYIKV